jgi:hypothetical protein
MFGLNFEGFGDMMIFVLLKEKLSAVYSIKKMHWW